MLEVILSVKAKVVVSSRTEFENIRRLSKVDEQKFGKERIRREMYRRRRRKKTMEGLEDLPHIGCVAIETLSAQSRRVMARQSTSLSWLLSARERTSRANNNASIYCTVNDVEADLHRLP